MRIFTFILSLTLALICTGCIETIDSRIADKQALFQTYSPKVQARIHKAHVKIGDTKDIVWFCFGEPTRRRIRETKTGKIETWSYTINAINELGSPYRPAVYYDRTPSGRTVRRQEYIYDPIYYTSEIETLRLEFTNGLLSEIEQPLD